MSRGFAAGVMGNALAMRNKALAELQRAESPVRALAHDGAVGLGVLIWGFLNGRYQNPKAGGKVGWDGLSALVFYGTSLATHAFGGPRLLTEGTRVAGSAGLFSYLNKIGAGLGVDSRASAAPADKPATSGYQGQYNNMTGAMSADEAALYTR